MQSQQIPAKGETMQPENYVTLLVGVCNFVHRNG